MAYKKILNYFKNKKILVIGDLILDRYIWGNVSRISPEAPVPIVEVTEEVFLLGGSTNVAHNIRSLGGQATVVGMAGNDRAGDILMKLLEDKGIQNGGVFRSSRPTTVKTRVIAHSQQVVRFDREDKNKAYGKIHKALLERIKNAVSDHDAVIVSDYKKGMVSSGIVRGLVQYAKPGKTFISVDPKIRHFHCYKNVSLITPNVAEASHASGIEIKDEKSLIKAGSALLRKVSCDAVLVTRGEHGMSLFTKNKVVHIPTVAKTVYDVTGAGDTVIAAFTLSYVSGASMEEAATIANYAAGIVVGEFGTAVVPYEKLLHSFKTNKVYPE